MPPAIATVVYVALILGLFRLDHDRRSSVSPALWLPCLWLAICSSRAVGLWFGGPSVLEYADQMAEGSPFDRNLLSVILVAALLVLAARKERTLEVLRSNGPLLVFFAFAGLSVVWSEYPYIALRRWVKASGHLVMVLMVVTELDPLAAVKRLMTRCAFVLIPLSILFIKYYPNWGRSWHRYTGDTFLQGVSIGKNGLGLVLLIFGMAVLWRLLHEFDRNDGRRRTASLVANGVVLTMALWLFWQVDSVTALVCFLVGSATMVVLRRPRFARSHGAVYALIGVSVLAPVAIVVFGIGTGLLESMGRDATLTGRTLLWEDVSRLNQSLVLGTGFESFWLGDRLDFFLETYWWRPNQAHNGYLEIFVNLGAVGLLLHAAVIVWGCRKLVGGLGQSPELGCLMLAFFVVTLLYNFSEAGFRSMHASWFIFLLATVPRGKPTPLAVRRAEVGTLRMGPRLGVAPIGSLESFGDLMPRGSVGRRDTSSPATSTSVELPRVSWKRPPIGQSRPR